MAAAGKPSINLNEKIPSEDHLEALGSPDVVPNATAGDAPASLEAAPLAAAGCPTSDIGRRMRRAERFGMPVQLSEEEKRSSRAERFGTALGPNKSNVLGKSEEMKRKARAERFGTPVPSTPLDEEAKRKARGARFSTGLAADPQEEDKKKFSDIPKAAGAGKASVA
ncbi:hypothetical protein MLD38_020257 [Melastoma candidum]|uniref:Uncharacterized protein n=1 Tax=Melastoma candidum TaxID=119954 RepID=A0ACB9QCS1_9MYRT|nr:hypothetical protein MLD38_020257 [Melastoma candidum]